MKDLIRTEICVLGGGPAGSAISRQLALLGHEVWLVERARFPRSHVGESLTPGILPSLETLGVRQRVEQEGFLRPGGAMVRWENATEYRESPREARGFQVDRGRFDGLLLEAAREAGAQILQPAIAGAPSHEGARQWRIPIRRGEQEITLHTRFVVDATGRRAVLGGSKRRCSAPTLALYAYWRDVGIKSPETRVEAGPEEWFWGAPLPDGTFNAAVFLDPKRCVGRTRHNLEAFYRSLLAQSSLLSDCLEGASASEVLACNASTYQDEHPISEDFIKVGEASFSIDPLSSQGVQAALRSACQGAVVVHTLLTAPANASAALQFYRNQQTETVAQHTALAARYYAAPRSFGDHPFWRRRAAVSLDEDKASREAPRPPAQPFSLDSRLKLSEEVRWLEIPCLQDSLIKRVRALHISTLERPVAFLDDVLIEGLLHSLSETKSVREILEQWSLSVSERRKLEWIHWMCRLGILIPPLQ